jgi:hypothetical protein
MIKISMLVLLFSAAMAGDGGGNPAKCKRRDAGTMPVFFKLKQPVEEHGQAARTILRQQFPCLALMCTRKGDMFADFSEREAKKLLGRHIAHEVVEGAGNSADSSAVFVTLRPANFVPEILKAHVARVEINDDPKFMYTAPKASKCE